nr:PEP-CTERM sorting domain-containing protein [Azohydromonas aeria]
MRNDLSHQATLWGKWGKWGVVAFSAVPGVPEPSTYALMLAGVGLVGWVARRRSARQP